MCASRTPTSSRYFFAYPDNEEVNGIVSRYIAGEPEYDFVAEDGFGHHFWVIDNDADIERITEIFAEIPAFYVADGHHLLLRLHVLEPSSAARTLHTQEMRNTTSS